MDNCRLFTKMLGLCLVIVVIIGGDVFASVKTLEDGACWFQKVDGYIKLASFNERMTAETSLGSMRFSVREFLNAENFSIEKTQVFCSSAFSAVLLGVKFQNEYRCFHFFIGNTGLELVSSYEDDGEEGACLGHESGKILAGSLISAKDREYILYNYSSVESIDGIVIQIRPNTKTAMELKAELGADPFLKNYKFNLDKILFPAGSFEEVH